MERPSRLQVEREWCQTEFQDANLSMATDSKWITELAGHEFDEKWLTKINEDLVSIGSLELDEDNKDLYGYILGARYEFFDNVLGWDDEASMLYPAYEKFRIKEQYLLPLASAIERFRSVAASGHNAAHVLRRFPNLLTTTDRYFNVLMAHVRKASTEALLPVMQEASAEVEIHVKKPRKPTSFAQLRKVDVEDYHTPDEIEQLLKVFANYGIDAERVIAAQGRGLMNTVDVIESRLKSLEDMGLHPATVVRGYDEILLLKTEHVREKIPVVRNYLNALHSDLALTKFINERPRILARSASRLLTVGDMFESSTDLTGVPSGQVESFARYSFDTGFAALIDKALKGELVQANDLKLMSKAFEGYERRLYNLESLRNTSIRQVLSDRAIHAYMTAQPLTEHELATYPDLASL